MPEKVFQRNQPPELLELLEATPLFEGLPDESLTDVLSHAVTRKHPANRVILLENDWGGIGLFYFKRMG